MSIRSYLAGHCLPLAALLALAPPLLTAMPAAGASQAHRPAAGRATFPASGNAGASRLKAGSDNVAVIEPKVVVPDETPCVVPLYKKAQFGADTVNFSYAPPPGCPGPWAKIVLSIDTSLDKGIQYDRTGTLFVGGVPLWFGTTSEPTPKLAPSWHIERDVTDYTTLLKTAQTGFVLVANYTNAQDTSIITTSGQLLFYPANATYPAPRTPDQVIAFAQPGGGTVGLASPTDMLTITPNLPTNVVAASLDVFIQGQSGDEFWYTCVPNNLTGPLESCGGGSFREGEVTIDGTPAGVAPVFPWIFTGGIDPYLWLPIPGVQTLNFRPFRVELSPFAGVLSNGQPHSISLSVAGSNNFFSATGALLLYTDPDAATVTGAVTTNTLKPANPIVTNRIMTADGATTGTLDTLSRHDFTIAGYAMTSAGKTVSSVHQTTKFSNHQRFDITDTLYKQLITQSTDTLVESDTNTGPTTNVVKSNYSYPLSVKLTERFAPNGDGSQATLIDQQYLKSVMTENNGQPTNQTTLANAIAAADTLLFDSNFNITGHKKQSSTASYLTTGNNGCFQRKLTAANNTLLSVQNGCK